MIGLHLAAITLYEAYKRQPLIVPMITGKKPVPDDLPLDTPVAHNRLFTAALLLAISATFVYWLVNYV